MSLWQRLKRAASNLRHKGRLESDLDAELRAYAEGVTEEELRAGLSPAEARRRALAEMGGLEQVKQAVRESRAGATVASLWDDLRYGLRVLGGSPSFTWTAVLTLALGIGVTSSVFSVLYSLLLRPLPFDQPDQLVSITAQSPKFRADVLISPDFVAAQQTLKSFSQVAGYWWANRNLTGLGDPVRIVSVAASANFFPMLGVAPQLGRTFAASEDRAGGPPVILLSNRFWRAQFQADPNVIGKAVAVDGKQQTILGVLPADFSFPNYGLEPDVYQPADLDGDTTVSPMRPVMGIFTIGRLRPGVTAEQAQAELQAFFEARGRSYAPGFEFLSNGRRAAVESLRSHLTGSDRRPILILFAAALGVLLIACSNVANLQLARAVSSRHEIAVRGALGASRLRLIRKLLVESLILSLAAGLGVVIALLATALFHHAGTGSSSSTVSYDGRSFQAPIGKLSTLIQFNGTALAFTLALTLVTTLLSGLAPALNGARTDLRRALQSAALRVTSSREQGILRHALLVLQISLAVMLLANAGLLVRSFLNMLQYGSGFNAESTLSGRTLLTGSRYQSADARRNFAHVLLPRLAALPGVQAAALTSALPLAHVDSGAVSFSDDPNPPLAKRQTLTMISVTPDYFRSMETPLLQGRAFTGDDTPISARVAIVNRTFASRYFAGDAVGKQFNVGISNGGQFQFLPVTIVGIAADVRHNGLVATVAPEIYRPMDQAPSGEADILLRTSVEPSSLANAMRQAVLAADSQQPLFDIETMNERLANLVAPQRLLMFLIVCFAALAVALSAVGVFGVFVYSVSQRTQEMGIRLALGASRASLLQLVVLQAARLILFGGAIGVGGALLLSRFLAGTLTGVSPHDPLSFTLAWALMTAIALCASVIPAMNAAGTDLMSVLRQE